MSFGYDDELPAGFNDADLEMRELAAAADAASRARDRGECDHGWSGPAQADPTQRVCYHCGANMGPINLVAK